MDIDTNLPQAVENRKEFPTIYLVSLDYLAIQASSVPSECAFSSSADTDTARRNRISPVLMEALQMLKFSLRNGPMDFMQDIMTSEEDLRRSRPGDLLSMLARSGNTDECENIMDQIVRIIA